MENLYPFGRIMAMVAVLFLAATACDTNDSDDTDLDLMPVNTVTTDGYTLSLFADRTLETGVNTLYWTVEKGGNDVPIQSFSVMPMMDMGEMQHSAPHDSPILHEEDDDYYYHKMIFVMPSGEMGSWALNFEIETKDGNNITGEMPLEVDASWRLTSVKDANDKIYFISWMDPYKPVSGNNKLNFMVHTRENMMSFPAVDNLELIIYPYMDMGGGQGHSTDFNHPTGQGKGLYSGSINYSMSGVWTTSVRIVADNDTLPEAVFEYSVQAK
ncbi:MAG: hypothetical protein FH748_07840 [Balneolaceae bacterium]|nr:hypothetical protein [Balneolaceae bacterium]